MNELALFAGCGGGILGGVLLGWTTVGAVEIDPFRRDILFARQRDGCLPRFPVWDDIRQFNGHPWRGLVDVVSGGFPCQPYSVTGGRKGDKDPRNLWPDTARVLREVGSRFALLENVPGLLSFAYFGTVLGDLVDAGYGVEWDVIAASDAGAPHCRERLWILAYRDQDGIVPARGRGKDLARCGTLRQRGQKKYGLTDLFATPWPPGPGDVARIPRVVDGVPGTGMDRRNAALGDAQVPQVAAMAWRTLMTRAGYDWVTGLHLC